MSEGIRPTPDAFAVSGNWTREQTLLAFRFYCETPFGQLHGRNKKVVELAGLIGRTPGALAMRCVNFASLDPKIRESGRSGLGHASDLDRRIWEEAHANWSQTIAECEALLAHRRRARDLPLADSGDLHFPEEWDFAGDVRAALVHQRVGQSFFRRTVLSSYGERCCVSGLGDRRFLIASHIVPWSEDTSIRLHPGNGLCLSAIHDRAFDNHLFSLADDYRIILSAELRETKDEFLKKLFLPIEGKSIALPEKFAPKAEFIARHRRILLDNCVN